ncbi:DUF2285 domain-containing protein [Agrobacterium vitis]|uniref:DUF2285 domain-containing protein n=1 Tax=Agrobacterium vitis TaxID=373 RepID=UPI001F2B53C7|nr:DUF2285 domain-containing protein [Agrobacterium vitis]
MYFPLDPDVPAWLTQPLWHPDIDPEAILVAEAPAGHSECLEFNPENLPAMVRGVGREQAVYIPASGPDGSLRIWFTDGSLPTRAAALLPMDGDLDIRLHSLQRMRRWLSHRQAGPVMRQQQISVFHRHRFILMLRVLDGLRDGASRREIASVMFNRNFRTISAVEWQNTSERRHLARLIVEAKDYVCGGYRRILRGGAPKGQLFRNAGNQDVTSA